MLCNNFIQRPFILLVVTVSIYYFFVYPYSAMESFDRPKGTSSSKSENRITEKTVTWPEKLSTTAAVLTENPIRNLTLAPNDTSKVNFETTVVNSSVANITALNLTRFNANPLLVMENNTKYEAKPVLPLCTISHGISPIPLNKAEMELEDVQKKYPAVHWGGRYSPRDCAARHRVAIIVPFRDRKHHLAIFLNHMHPFLMRQKIKYGIFIVEQEDKSPFNRAKLLNVGFVESQKQTAGGWQCFIFHDVDLLPLDDRTKYSCSAQPQHMCASLFFLKNKIETFKTTHSRSFGGVSAMTKEQFEAVNGFSNKYWGWGGEDNDMFYRIQKKGFRIRKYDRFSSRYAMLDHEKTSPNPRRFDLLKEATKGGRLYHDGLSDLDYAVKKIVKYRLHTHILVDLHYAAQAQLRTTPRSCPTSKGGNATHCAAPQTAHAATHSGLKSNRST